MPLKKIITVPSETLRKISEPLENVGKEEKKLIKDLFETMYHNKGIGLAAIQVGIPKRIIVLDVSKDEKKRDPLCFINPVIKKQSDEKSVYEEGCLSLPDTFIEIERPKLCWIEYIDIDGKKKEIKCDDLLSTCIQHEIDHLNGKLLVDYASSLKRSRIKEKLMKSKDGKNKN